MPFAVELHVDAVMLKALGVQPAAEPGLAEQFDRGRFQHAGPLPRLAVRPAAVLHAHRVDAAEGKQVREKQAGRPGAHDPDLGALVHCHPGTALPVPLTSLYVAI